MGSEKDRQQENVEAWRKLAETKGYKCAVGGEDIAYEEREIFFDTGMCGWHAHTAAKDD